MHKIGFSTGSASFDKYLGGINSGDTLLIYSSKINDANSIVENIVQFTSLSNIQITIVNFSNSVNLNVKHNNNIKNIDFPVEVIRQKSFLKKFRIQLRGIKNSSLIILNNISGLADSGLSDEYIQKIFSQFKDLCQQKKAFGVATLIRESFTPQLLASLKDISTICIDLVLFKNGIYCLPISLKNRYIPANIIPYKYQSESGIDTLQKPTDSSIDSIFEKHNLRFEESFKKSNDALLIIDEKGALREFNDKAINLLGYAADELKLIPLSALVSTPDRYKFLKSIIELKKKHSISFEVELRKRNGKHLPAEVLISQLSDHRYFVIVHDQKDNHERIKILEAQKSEYQNILLSAGYPIIILQENKIVLLNAAFMKMVGSNAESEILSLNIKSFLDPASFRRFQKYFHDSQELPEIADLQFIGKEGNSLSTRVRIQQIIYGSKKSFQLSIQDNSTEQRLVEGITKKLVRYQHLVESSKLPTAIIREGKIIVANQEFIKLSKLDLSKLIGIDIVSLIPQDEKEKFTEYWLKYTSGKIKTDQLQVDFKESDGKIAHYILHFASIKESKPSEVMVYFDDRTKETSYEQEINQRRNEIEFVKNISQTILNTFEVQKILRTSLSKISELTGLESGAIYLLDDSRQKMILTDSKNMSGGVIEKINELEIEHGIGGFISKTLLPQIFKIEKYPSYLPHRNIFVSAGYKIISFIPLVANEKLIGMFLYASKKYDTFSKFTTDLYTAIGNILGEHISNARLFNGIKEASETASSMIESSLDILYNASSSMKFNFINERIELLTGYTRREIMRVKDLWLKLIHPEDKKYYLERITRIESIQQRDQIEYRILPKGKAEYRIINDTIEVIRDNDGSVRQILGTIRDITESQSSMRVLNKDYQFQKNILASVPESVIVINDFQKCIYCNKAFENLFNVNFKNIEKEDARSIFTFYQENKFNEIIDKVQTWNISEQIEIAWKESETSAEKFVRATFKSLTDPDDNKIGTVISFIDITDQKRSENEIRESQYVLSNVIDTMGDILILTNLQGTVVQVNRTFLNVLGYSRNETNGCEFPYPWLLDDEMGRFVLWIASLREQNWLHDFDMTMRAKDGKLIPISLSTTLLRNRMGEPIAMLNIARNITDRKKLVSTLESRNKQIELFNRIITKANRTFDLRDIFVTISHEIKNIILCDEIRIGILSEDRESLSIYSDSKKGGVGEKRNLDLSQTLSHYVIREQKSIIIADTQVDERYKNINTDRDEIRSQVGIPITLKDKIYGTLELASIEPYAFSEEQLNMLIPIAQQIGSIIDRAILFKQVSDDSSYIHNLLDSIKSIVYTVDTELRIREVNDAWHQFMKENGRAGIADYEGKYLFDLLPNDAVKFILQGAVEQLLSGSINYFSQEILYTTTTGDKIYQLIVNSMVIGNRITGLVFTQTDITHLKKTEAELKKSNEQLITLNKISNIISSSLQFESMLETTLPLLKNLIGSYAVILYLRETETNEFNVAYQSGFNSEEYGNIIRFKQSVRSGTSVTLAPKFISENASLDENIIPANREILKHLKLNAVATIPIISGDQANGILALFFKQVHKFSEQEEQILTLAGNQFGTAIQNTKLYSELKSQVERLSVLYEISSELTSTLNIDEIFDTVYKHVKKVIPFQMFKVDLYDEKSKTKTPVLHVEKLAGDEIFITASGQPSVVMEGTTQEQVIRSRKPHYSADHRTITIPMLSKNILFGIMSIEADVDVVYIETQIKLIESIANLTALALEKGKLYEETLLKSSEIQKRNKELDDFTYVVSHDLKEPLISVEGFSRILQADYNDLIQEEGKEYLESIVGATTRMKGLIDDLLLLSRVSRPTESFKDIYIGDVIRDIQTDMEFTIKQKNVQFSIPEQLPVVFGNDTQVRIVFRNLIGNAVKFNDKMSPAIEVKFQNAENNYYLFSIKDNGIGIDRDFYEKIFVIFQRLHRREEYEGTGAGLAIVKKIIELHQGKIWVESELGTGSTFYFTLPGKV
ncbi:MAG: PAS domain S-box protein [Ignavibacteriales bacterium]|nr:PAS domain S-box protein [Ignavibacteriales bacterium]